MVGSNSRDAEESLPSWHESGYMARLVHCKINKMALVMTSDQLDYQPILQHQKNLTSKVFEFDLPQLYWSNGKTWDEANLWLFERLMFTRRGVHLKTQTVNRNGYAALSYMNYMESEGLDWRHAPIRYDDDSMTLYRGWLIGRRDGVYEGQLSPSTPPSYINDAIALFKWLVKNNFLDENAFKIEEYKRTVTRTDKFGLPQPTTLTTNNYTILNNTQNQIKLEDGVLPVSTEMRDTIISLARDLAPYELYLMLKLGFFTGMRIGSITTLKRQTFDNATIVPFTNGTIMELSIGPNIAYAPVATKNSKNGKVIIPTDLYEEIRSYLDSTRRIKRESKASPADKNVVFLTQHGTTYERNEVTDASSINSAMSRFRKKTKNHGHNIKNFYFHQSRATFATCVAHMAISNSTGRSLGNILAMIQNLLMHESPDVSLAYIQLLEQRQIQSEWANLYTNLFSGALTV